LRALEAAGVAVPILRDEPKLTHFQSLAFTAWRDLCGERAVGLSLGPIPWRAIVAWCDRYRVLDAEALIELVQCIDTEWLSSASTRSQHSGDPAATQGQKRH
jgi:hypothetical protein